MAKSYIGSIISNYSSLVLYLMPIGLDCGVCTFLNEGKPTTIGWNMETQNGRGKHVQLLYGTTAETYLVVELCCGG